MREAYASLVAATIAHIEQHLEQHPVSSDPKKRRIAWAVASYKLTHDPAYEKDLEVNWSEVDPDLLGLDEEEDDTLVTLQDVVVEKRLSFPWLFPDALFEVFQQYS